MAASHAAVKWSKQSTPNKFWLKLVKWSNKRNKIENWTEIRLL